MNEKFLKVLKTTKNFGKRNLRFFAAVAAITLLYIVAKVFLSIDVPQEVLEANKDRLLSGVMFILASIMMGLFLSPEPSEGTLWNKGLERVIIVSLITAIQIVGLVFFFPAWILMPAAVFLIYSLYGYIVYPRDLDVYLFSAAFVIITTFLAVGLGFVQKWLL